MPIWKVQCPVCGHHESALTSLSRREADGGLVRCGRCEALCEVRPTAAILHSSERELRVGGRTFGSAREVDAFSEKTGVVPVARSSDDFKDRLHDAQAGADRLAKAHGFDSHADRMAREKTEHLQARARDNMAKKIETYHNIHGSDGKKSVDQALKET